MGDDLPKVVHPVGDRPMICIVDACRARRVRTPHRRRRVQAGTHAIGPRRRRRRVRRAANSGHRSRPCRKPRTCSKRGPNAAAAIVPRATARSSVPRQSPRLLLRSTATPTPPRHRHLDHRRPHGLRATPRRRTERNAGWRQDGGVAVGPRHGSYAMSSGSDEFLSSDSAWSAVVARSRSQRVQPSPYQHQ